VAWLKQTPGYSKVTVTRGTNYSLQRPTSLTFPGSFKSPPQRELGKKDPGSGWSRVLVTNLYYWEGSQIFGILSPLVFVSSKSYFASLRAISESFLSISQRRFSTDIYDIAFNIGSGNCKKIRLSNYAGWFSSTRDVYHNCFSRYKKRTECYLPC